MLIFMRTLYSKISVAGYNYGYNVSPFKKLSKYSPAQMIKKLSRVRTVYASGKWNRAEMTKKETDLMAEIGWDIT